MLVLELEKVIYFKNLPKNHFNKKKYILYVRNYFISRIT